MDHIVLRGIFLLFLIITIPVRVEAQEQGNSNRLYSAYLSLSEAYDSNVLGSGGQSAHKGDSITYVQPGLSLLLPFRFGGDLNINYVFTYVRYAKFSMYSTYYNNLNASLNFYPVKNLKFGILDTYTIVPISPRLPTFAATNITQANYLNPYVYYKLMFSQRIGIDGRYDFIMVDFPGSLGINYTVNEPEISAFAIVNRYTKFKAGYKYISQVFTPSSIGTIDQEIAYGEMELSDGSKLSFDATYGYESIGFTNYTDSGNVYDVKLAYKPDKRLETDVYINGSKTFDIFGRYYSQIESGVSLAYNLTERIKLSGDANYLKLKYAGYNYYTNAISGDIGLSYKFLRWSEIFATYYYYGETTESSAGNKYNDSRILLGIKAGIF